MLEVKTLFFISGKTCWVPTRSLPRSHTSWPRCGYQGFGERLSAEVFMQERLMVQVIMQGRLRWDTMLGLGVRSRQEWFQWPHLEKWGLEIWVSPLMNMKNMNVKIITSLFKIWDFMRWVRKHGPGHPYLKILWKQTQKHGSWHKLSDQNMVLFQKHKNIIFSF